jgi:catechol 2,3-dioxygenase-like lactoylglutathione lyase family enzyme/ketosteroid isomerase-like protein
MRKANYASRDQASEVAFYVLLWKRKDLSLKTFDDYWRDVHGPVCARLPDQHQYWQFHLAHNSGDLMPPLPGIETVCSEEDQIDGIAELTFKSSDERTNWFKAAALLMDDERNLFSKAIGYNTSAGHSQTMVDSIDLGAPNGPLGVLKYHLLIQKVDNVDSQTFQRYLQETLGPTLAASDLLLKLRLHLFDAVDNSRPDAPDVVHTEAPEKQYQAALEIAFLNHHDKAAFFASDLFLQATAQLQRYVRRVNCFPERSVYTFVYDGQMTTAGQRSANVAELISTVGATNQLEQEVTSLMLNGSAKRSKSSLGAHLNGVHHVGITVENMAESLEFYTEVLGGKLALGGENFYGENLHNTLFQKEDLDANALGIDAAQLGVPDLREGNRQMLDVNFISFGDTVVELIYYRNAASKPSGAEPFARHNPSSTAFITSSHLSFWVKEDIDLNVYARKLEEECQLRGISKVRCNRILHVDTEEQRQQVELPYNSNKFWDETEKPDNFGGFYGWALFYCKGPNGEQLEFNQVTRGARQSFRKAREEYMAANRPNPLRLEDPPSQLASAPTAQREAGALSQLVRQMFMAGESMNVENFVKFYTDDALYQFSNFPIVYGPKGISESSGPFLEKVRYVSHDIRHMYEHGDTVICRMDVTYIRHDGQVFTLPCCDTIRFQGDKVQEMRIYMDITPVFSEISHTGSEIPSLNHSLAGVQ